MISAKFRIGSFASEVSLLNTPVGRAIKRLKSKKRGTFNIDIDSKKYLLKSCAVVYKENCRLYVNFQSKTESKMVMFAQMKPPITNLNLDKLIS